MSTFDEREKSFEKKFAHDEEKQFKISARTVVPDLTFDCTCATWQRLNSLSENSSVLRHYLTFNNQPCVPSVYTKVLAALSVDTVKSAAVPCIFSEFLPIVKLFESNVPA